MRKKMEKVLVILCSMVLVGSSSKAMLVHAEENGEVKECAYEELTGDNVAYGINDVEGNLNSRAVTLANCVIGISVDENGAHVSITTGATEVSSDIGAKDVYIQYKDAIGFWHNINSTPLSGSESNTDHYEIGYVYKAAQKGVYYRAKCTHYAYLSDGYHSISNETDGICY